MLIILKFLGMGMDCELLIYWFVLWKNSMFVRVMMNVGILM